MKFQFRLGNIKILRSEVRDHPIVFSEDFDFEKVTTDVELRFNYYEDYVQAFFHFLFETDYKSKNITLGHFDIAYTFEVKDLIDILENEESKKLMELNLISVAYSTSRGVLFSETKSYAINELYLPPISANELHETLVEPMKKVSTT